MLFLDLTLDSPQENLALDEALLLDAEGHEGPREVARIWESPATFVVLGSSSRYEIEANVANCQRDGCRFCGVQAAARRSLPAAAA